MTKNQIKQIQKLKQKKYRISERKFIIEGSHLVEECIKSNSYNKLIDYIIVSHEFKKKELIDLLKKKKYRIEFIDNKNFNKLSETENPEGIIAVVNFPEIPVEKTQQTDLIVCLDRINDPGNLGTILRTCWWFGIQKVIISKDSADIYNSKVLRASQGAIFNLYTISDIDLNQYLENLYKDNYIIYLTSLNSKNLLSKINFTINKKYAIVFGNEVKGVSENLLQNKNYSTIKIDSYTNCESLNVSVAAGIIISHIKLKLLNKA